MDDDFELSPGIGPHNDRELELMLAGTKPIAIPSDTIHASANSTRGHLISKFQSKRISRFPL
jgi:hypothetical protein